MMPSFCSNSSCSARISSLSFPMRGLVLASVSVIEFTIYFARSTYLYVWLIPRLYRGGAPQDGGFERNPAYKKAGRIQPATLSLLKFGSMLNGERLSPDKPPSSLSPMNPLLSPSIYVKTPPLFVMVTSSHTDSDEQISTSGERSATTSVSCEGVICFSICVDCSVRGHAFRMCSQIISRVAPGSK